MTSAEDIEFLIGGENMWLITDNVREIDGSWVPQGPVEDLYDRTAQGWSANELFYELRETILFVLREEEEIGRKREHTQRI